MNLKIFEFSHMLQSESLEYKCYVKAARSKLDSDVNNMTFNMHSVGGMIYSNDKCDVIFWEIENLSSSTMSCVEFSLC